MSSDAGLTTRWGPLSWEEGSLWWWPTQELLTTLEGSMAVVVVEEEGDDERRPLLAVVPPPEEVELMLAAKVPLQCPLGDGEGFSRPCSRSLSLNCVLAIEQRGGSDGRFLLQQQEDYEEDEDEGPFLYRLSKTLPLSFSCGGGGGCLSRVRCLFFFALPPPPFLDRRRRCLLGRGKRPELSSPLFTW